MPPALFTTEVKDYAAFFASEMALVLVAALGLTAYTARSLGRPWLLPAAVFVAAALLLYPVAVTRYDAVVALAVAVASAAASGRSYVTLAAWASLGFGAAAKLVPALATLPLALVTGYRLTARSVAWGFAVFFCAAAAFFLPAYLLGGAGFVESFAYHADRGLQLESVPASVLMQLGWLENVSFEYGAFEARGRGVELLASASLPETVVLLALTAVVMLRERRRFGSESFPRFAAAFVLAFLVGSKVLSPQYVIWLLPLIPLSARGAWGFGASGVFLALCWTTTQVYAHHYGELVHLQPPATDLLAGRNLLLVVLWALMLSLPFGDKLHLGVEEGSNSRIANRESRVEKSTTPDTDHSRLTDLSTDQEHEPLRDPEQEEKREPTSGFATERGEQS